ncbi:ferrous iron transport protein A [Streptomyces massasporeus]|uniref:ferrous iron transport protein A n=1 Tax=Streptomyces massasporeus TaxID=67324 RepID=UPI0036F8E114
MSVRPAPSRKKVTVVVWAISALVAVLSGCGGDESERDYAVPDSLCGVAVDADELGPFLPDGKEITVRDKSGGGTTVCEVVVDDELALRATQAWVEEGKTTAYFASSQTLTAPEESAEDDRLRYSGNEAFGKTKDCIDKQHGQELYTAVQAQGSDHKDADAMKRLITDYTSEVEGSTSCEADGSE